MKLKAALSIGLMACAGSMATASVGDIASWVDSPRLFNDFGGSTLNFNSNYDPMG
ncbi:unnamed protein product, partial [Laminaria digitata]